MSEGGQIPANEIHMWYIYNEQCPMNRKPQTLRTEVIKQKWLRDQTRRDTETVERIFGNLVGIEMQQLGVPKA